MGATVSVKVVGYADKKPLPQCLVVLDDMWIDKAANWAVLPGSAMGKSGTGTVRSDVQGRMLYCDNPDHTLAFYWNTVDNPLKIGAWGYGQHGEEGKDIPRNFQWQVIAIASAADPNWESIDIGVDFSGLSDSGGDDSDADS
jgi:hypothetical protein